MIDHIDPNNYRGESLLPFDNLELQFRDWVSWLESVEAPFIGPQSTRAPGRQADPARPSFDPGLQWEDGWRWCDVGGESGEAV